MKNWWLKLGCFLTGYNYYLVRVCSEITTKTVKRYASALIIVCILWSFIGYTFSSRYLNGGIVGGVIGALILLTIIIQIERQIILTIHPSKLLYAFRGFIAVAMALIGSVIIDQIIFKEDIEQKKIMVVDEKVDKLLPAKTEELKHQIAQLDTAISVKEIQRQILQQDIQNNPTISTVTISSTPVAVGTTVIDSNKNQRTTQKLVNANTVTKSAIPNPNIQLLTSLDQNIKDLRLNKEQKDSTLLTLRPALTKDLLQRKGFLDEMEVMYRLISESGVALFVWSLWILIIFSIELFILVSKMGEKQTDYDALIQHQMDLHLNKLKVLDRNSRKE